MKLTIYRNLFLGFLCMIGSISFNACDKDEPSLVAATFISIVSDVQQTPRLVNTFWSPGDAVGISGTSAGVVYANVKYVTTGADGRFTVAEADKDIYYQSDEQVNFTAYYPFTGTGGSAAGVITHEITAADQTADTQPFIDYLYGTGVGSAANPELKLYFDHCMSRVVLNFQTGSGFDALPEKVECTVGGLVMHGSFDTSAGKAYVAEGELGKSITLDVASTTVGTRLLTLADYTASDLMTVRGTVSTRTDGTADSTLSFAMQRMILCIVRLPHTTCNYQESIRGMSFDKSYSLYTGASFSSSWKENHYTARYILKPGKNFYLNNSFYNSDFKECQYTGWTGSITSSLSGKYILHTIDGGEEEVKDRPLQEGDFYMKDGTVLPQEAFNDGAAIPYEVKKDCIGVVFWVGEKDGMHWTQTGYKRGDHLLMDEHLECTHGMVVALQNASEYPVVWATNPLDGESLWNWAYAFNGFTDNEKSLWKMIYNSNSKYGYANNALGCTPLSIKILIFQPTRQ